jgi:clan AA aspartic protease (TIGR02281 family)
MSFANKTAFCVLILAMAQPGQSHAQTYKWADESGEASYTDDTTAIPSNRRSSAVILREQALRPEMQNDKKQGGGEVSRPAPSQSGEKGDILYIAPLKASGFGYYVEVEVNRGVRLNMLVDTGSSFTMLNVDAARRLGITGLDALPKMPVSTAGGVTWIHLVELASVKVGGAEAVSVEGGVSDQIGGGLDGLLGVSFLGEFVYQMDGPGSKLTLKSDRSADAKGEGGKAWRLMRRNRYVENIRRFTALKKSLETGAPVDDPEFKKTPGFTSENAGKIIAYYTRLLNSLDRRASAVGAPVEPRVYP